MVMQPVEEELVSERAIDWEKFSSKMHEHIETYTVPQYGDKGEDNITSWSAEECFKQVDKYLKRRNTSRRPNEKLLDLLKACHYLQMGYDKLVEEESN